MTTTTQTIDCPLCDAEGGIPVRLERSPDGWPVGVYAECPLCRGKGQVTPEQADDYRHETEGGIR
jgi:hypothetical protein